MLDKEKKKQIPLELPFTDAMETDNFLMTECNQEAVQWIQKWSEWEHTGLVIIGSPGSGKTHLTKLWLELSKGKKLTKLELLEKSSMEITKDSPHIAIDDADIIANDIKAEEKLFHLFNYLKEKQGSLLLTFKQEIPMIRFRLPDLSSRLLTLPVARLGYPDDVLLEALIIKQFHDRQISLDEGVLSYLITHAPRDAASVRSLIDKLDTESLTEQKKISIKLAKRVLTEF
ncbi:MAG: DnaA/Hda family protein [Alphaproteobacteria bacterium]|nr:DnaA/Hda family protein [Alphaproteobacteria bacterium]MCL2505817.1 DnaA/Hda family protein [Alphaproteobacteria bacterium]